VLPCFLTLTSDDVGLLDYLARPDTPVVRLMRRVRHFTTETRETRMSDHYGPLSPRPTGLATFSDKEALKTVLHEVDTAVWWVPAANEVPQGPYARHLDGEIHISEDLQPSCDCKIFHIEVSHSSDVNNLIPNRILIVYNSTLLRCFPFTPTNSNQTPVLRRRASGKKS